MPRVRSSLKILALMAAILASAAAAAESARLECSIGFGSYCVPRRWIPLYVRGDKSVDSGLIEVRRLDASGRALSVEVFPYRESVRLECPVMMDEACASLQVSLKSRGHVLADTRLGMWEKVFPGHIILQSGMPSAAQRALSSLLLPAEPVQVVSVRPQDLPSMALDYDGVSAIAMADPGASLSPSQGEALRAWVAGGGRLVVTGARPGKSGVLSALGLPGEADEARGFGLGRVAAFGREASELPRSSLSAALRQAIGLEPYGRTTRIAPGTMFPIEVAPEFPGERYSRPGSLLAVGFIFWAGAAAAVFLVRKRKLAYLLGVNLAFAVLAVPAGLSLDRSWHRGGRASVRLLSLPESSGFLAEAGFFLPTSAENGFMPIKMSAWNLDIGFDVSERGRLRPDAPAVWRHESQKPRFLLHSSGNGRLRLSGFLPQLVARDTSLPQLFEELVSAYGTPMPLKRARQAPLAYFSVHDGLWWSWDHFAWRWKASGACPEDFEPEEEWLRSAAETAGGAGIFAGKDDFKAMPFRMQGWTARGAVWARIDDAPRPAAGGGE